MIIWDKFKKLWKYYLFQGFLAAATVCILLLVFDKEDVVVIASMGATAFIVFAMPKSVSAKTRNVIGGHFVGLVCGAVFTFTVLPYYVEYPLAVAIAMFFMVALDVEHPPAAGTALAVAINEVTLGGAVVIMLSAVVITQCRHHMKKIIKDFV